MEPGDGDARGPGEFVELDPAEYESLRADARLAAEEQASLARELEEVGRQLRAEMVSAAVGQALTECGLEPLNDIAAAQLRQFLAERAEARQGEDGRPSVVDRDTGAPFVEAAAGWLKGSGDYGHLLAARSQGGPPLPHYLPNADPAAPRPSGGNPVEAALAAAWMGRRANPGGIPDFNTRRRP